jgi:3-oxoisoapionate kinase
MQRHPRLLLSYYGDDFTGSTDALEALAVNGVPTVLFLGIPTERLQTRFKGIRALGIASTSRSQSPAWMERHLSPALTWLKSFNAEICHYKTCSTFDSAPETGSIGKAMEIGMSVFMQRTVPILVGVPELKRYTAFGQLFAAFQGEIYRIDRHPVMSRHPVTPMAEADLRLHLAPQTNMPIGLIDAATLMSENYAAAADAAFSRHEGGMIIDVLDRVTQARAGEVIWQNKNPDGWFVVGSSGVEYALIQHWRQERLTTPSPVFEPVAKAKRIAAVSGSLSPMTAKQIAYAALHGFEVIAAQASRFAGDRAETEINAAITKAEGALRKGLSPLIHTQAEVQRDAGPQARLRQKIGPALGHILRKLIERHDLKRIAVAGGDTSGQVCEALEIEALTLRAPLPNSPGAPLCSAHSASGRAEGIEVALKGGQLGCERYFALVRDGN